LQRDEILFLVDKGRVPKTNGIGEWTFTLTVLINAFLWMVGLTGSQKYKSTLVL
jgi:hypothetical protein